MLIHGDVRSIDEDMVKSWLLKFPEAEEIHMWGGFPCNDLSSAKAYREELEGKDSSLFFEIPRVFQLIRSVAGKYITVKLAAENVASMSKPACQLNIKDTQTAAVLFGLFRRSSNESTTSLLVHRRHAKRC